MAAEYTIEKRESVLEVHVSGTPDRASIGKMWKDIVAASREYGCLYILGLSNMKQPLKLADAIDMQAIFLEAGVSSDHRIAWVQLNPEALAMTQIAESVLLNRGLANSRFFTDETVARRWLVGQ